MTVRPYLRRAELAAWDAPRIAASVSNMEAQAILIASGRFLGFLPTHYARPWVALGEMRAIDHLGIDWRSPFLLATRARPHAAADRPGVPGRHGSRDRTATGGRGRVVATENLQETYANPTPAAAVDRDREAARQPPVHLESPAFRR